MLNIEIDKYNKLYQSTPIDYPTNNLELNKSVLHLIKWELEYRGNHNSNPNRLTTKPIDIANIIDWYNCNYEANITENDLKGLNIQY